jgi:hypothetical protein
MDSIRPAVASRMFGLMIIQDLNGRLPLDRIALARPSVPASKQSVSNVRDSPEPKIG